MEQYIIRGGKPLKGEVTIGGAKNAALGILAAAIMADETVTIENMPNVRDTNVLLQAIQGIGATVDRISDNEVKIIKSSPAIRRNYLNIELSQLNKQYLR